MEKKEYIIKIQVDNGEQGTSQTGKNNNAKINKNNTEQAVGNESIKNAIKKVAPVVAGGKALVNFATSNVGTFTGDQRLQGQVNNALSMAGMTALAVTAPTTALVTLVTTAITSGITESYNQKIREKALEQERYKVGYTASNRSRR
jgi:hypothetical protein